jgi:hypothetical protein
MNWHSVLVPVNNMPYHLNLNNYEPIVKEWNRLRRDSEDNTPYFLRISAINAELGEGPYSHIIELRKINQSEWTKFYEDYLKNQTKILPFQNLRHLLIFELAALVQRIVKSCGFVI